MAEGNLGGLHNMIDLSAMCFQDLYNIDLERVRRYVVNYAIRTER